MVTGYLGERPYYGLCPHLLSAAQRQPEDSSSVLDCLRVRKGGDISSTRSPLGPSFPTLPWGRRVWWRHELG